MGTRTSRLTASTADRHRLYQASVQAPEHEIQFLSSVYRRHTGRRALALREDFCGTALLACAWARSHRDRTATGLDIDRDTLAWGRAHNLEPMRPEARARVRLFEQNVLVPTEAHDIVCAFNYSYQVFKTRTDLGRYFRAAHQSVAPDGLFVIDLLGGWESRQVLSESRKVGGFTYVWEQAAFDPISHDFLAHIHFHFPDGTKLERAFTYDWRLWTIPELRELLGEAGFVEVDVYWEGDDGKGGGNGVFERVERVHDDPGWNVYLVAKKSWPLPGSSDDRRRRRDASRARRPRA